MEFLVSWLADYVDLPSGFELEKDANERNRMRKIPLESRKAVRELGDQLTAVGLAVEGDRISMDGQDQELVLDVDVTGNRPDCMNYLGLAREIAVRRGVSLHPPVFSFTESLSSPGPKISVQLEDPKSCTRFTARVIRGVRVGPSPAWLVRRLEAIGSRSINNVVDATNFVLWETGQPLHAYDLATVPDGELHVRRARAGEKLTTLDGKERALDPEVLVVADRARAIGIGGIMGGLATEVTARTTDILLEAAHFDRRRVRIAAKRLAMHTDASHRFERGADREGCDEASRRCAALIVELAGGVIAAGALDVRGETTAPVRWNLVAPELERFAGVAIADTEIERILSGLGFAPERDGERRWQGTVPSSREVDFEPRPDRRPAREAWRQDIFEEVLRQIGFDAIPATLPAIGGVDAGDNPQHDRRDRLRDRLSGFGYAEAIHFAFGERAADSAFPKLAGEGEPIALANPLSELFAVMRRSLIPNLVAAADFNANRGARGVRLFESGHLFPGGAAPEVEALALIVGGSEGGPWDLRPEVDLFTLKGELEELLQDLGVSPQVTPSELPGIVSGSGAWLRHAGEIVGYFGRIAKTGTAFPLFVAELRLDRLPLCHETLRVQSPSRFPGIDADLTLTHSLDVPWQELAAAIRDVGVENLDRLSLKDRYQGAGIPRGAVATTIAFHFNAPERSLTQEEVNSGHLALSAELERRFGVARAGESPAGGEEKR
ncbi:MAG: phenylalanine--tRNA ligase subunit beta [Thermoanaerobaculia bacterium]